MRSPMGITNQAAETTVMNVLSCQYQGLTVLFFSAILKFCRSCSDRCFPRQHSNSLLLIELHNCRKPSLPEMVENVLSDEKYQVAVRLFCTKCQCGYSSSNSGQNEHLTAYRYLWS
jgi:hypothetical protein